MQKYISIRIFTLFLLVVGSAQAYSPRSGNIIGTLGPYWSKTEYPSSQTQNYSPVIQGFSLVANGDTGEWGSLEVALIYAPRLYYRQENGLTQLEKIERMHITMGYRWWLNQYLSTSLGLFSSYAMGDPVVEFTQYAPGAEIDTSARDTTEYGLDLAIQSEVWGSGKYAAVIEGRYSYSLTPKENEKSHHYGLSIGVRYLFQGAEAGTPEAKKIEQAAKKDPNAKEIIEKKPKTKK